MPRKPERPSRPAPRHRALDDEEFRQLQLERRQRLGAQVRALRVHMNLDQADLAERCGLSRPYIASVETGRGNPTLDTMWALADGLGVSPAELFIEEPLDW